MNSENAKRFLSPSERRELWCATLQSVLRAGSTLGSATAWADLAVEEYAKRVGELAYGPAKEQPR